MRSLPSFPQAGSWKRATHSLITTFKKSQLSTCVLCEFLWRLPLGKLSLSRSTLVTQLKRWKPKSKTRRESHYPSKVSSLMIAVGRLLHPLWLQHPKGVYSSPCVPVATLCEGFGRENHHSFGWGQWHNWKCENQNPGQDGNPTRRATSHPWKQAAARRVHTLWLPLYHRRINVSLTVSSDWWWWYSGPLGIGSMTLRVYCSKFGINFMTRSLSKCLLLLCVAPPIMFSLTSFPVTPTKGLAVGGPSLGDYNNLWYEDFLRAKFHNCFYTITLYFINFLSLGIVKYATPTRQLPLCTLRSM